uniref:Uncharacterized protein n=1 Tax=Zea mays TaxID=4577 RepID=C0PF98_MAIZE|nr:unknown [Zea mays]
MIIYEEKCQVYHASLPDHLSWVDCISCPPVRDLLILFPSTPVSREQIGTTSSCTLVGVLFESLPTVKASCPLCMNTFYYNSSSSLVRVRLDPTEWMQHIVEPPPTSWTQGHCHVDGIKLSSLHIPQFQETLKGSMSF